MSVRMASKTALNWESYLCSRAVSLRAGQSQGSSAQPERGRTDGTRAQEYQGTCVPADTRNAIVLKTEMGVTEDAIRSKMDPAGTNDWDNGGIPKRAAIPVLRAYGLNAEEVNNPTLIDVAKAATDNNLAMVSFPNGEGGFHAVLVVNSASAGTGQIFWVLDPWPGSPGGRRLSRL